MSFSLFLFVSNFLSLPLAITRSFSFSFCIMRRPIIISFFFLREPISGICYFYIPSHDVTKQGVCVFTEGFIYGTDTVGESIAYTPLTAWCQEGKCVMKLYGKLASHFTYFVHKSKVYFFVQPLTPTPTHYSLGRLHP